MRYFSLLLLFVFLVGCGETDSGETAGKTVTAEGVVDVNPGKDPVPLTELITYSGIAPGAQLVNPYTLTGEASADWYSKGSFSVTIVAEDGSLIAGAPAIAMGNRGASGRIPYQSNLTWIAGPDTRARLILTKGGAGADGGDRRAVEIPVVLK